MGNLRFIGAARAARVGAACAALTLAACGGATTSGGDGGGTDTGGGPRCTADIDCDDGVFCNGPERCAPANPTANTHGCIAPPATACASGGTCDELARTCRTACELSGDVDGDGHRSMACSGDDCDDGDGNRYPGNTEVCDTAGHDEDCDPSTYGSRDTDADGYVDLACCNTESGGAMHCGNDCDDMVGGTHPTATEVCNGRDDDCNGMTDEGVQMTFYVDDDLDMVGVDTMPTVMGCSLPMRYALHAGDCDDADPRVHPGAGEACNGHDDDCDGMTDEGTMGLTYYRDADADGWADPTMSTTTCPAPADYISPAPGRDPTMPGNADCDDMNRDAFPTAPELPADGVDENCDGSEVCYVDADMDGHRAGALDTVTTSDTACTAAMGHATASVPTDDCCDADGAAHPGVAAFSTVAVMGCGFFNYDFDCNGDMEKQLTVTGSCTMPARGGCDLVVGWRDPDTGGSGTTCGTSADYIVDCIPAATIDTCMAVLETRTQACR